MALTISTDLTTINTCQSTTNWTKTPAAGSTTVVAETDYSAQDTACIAFATGNTAATKGVWFNNSSGLNFSTTHQYKLVYLWVKCQTPGLLDSMANGGLRVVLGTDSSNYRTYYIAGNDYGLPDDEGWFPIAIDPSKSGSVADVGTFNLASVQYFGVEAKSTAGAKGNNIGIDRISYGRGEIRCYGTVTTSGAGFAELAAWDWGDKTNQRWGILTKRAGKIFVLGKIVIGDASGTNATTFSSTSEGLIWVTRQYYYSGSRVKALNDTDGAGAHYYGITVQGNATGQTNVTFGTVVGSDSGRSGPTFEAVNNENLSTPAKQVCKFIATASNITSLHMYGTTFRGFEVASPANAIDLTAVPSGNDVFACQFDACGRVYLGATEVRNCFFLNSYTDHSDGAIKWDSSTNLQTCSFVNNTHSIVFESTTGSPFTFTSITFGTTALAVRNESGGAIAISIAGGSTPTAENDGASSTTITSTKTLSVHVQDKNQASIVGAQVYVQRATPTAYTSGAGNSAGNGTLVVTQTIDSDVPIAGSLTVLDVSYSGVSGVQGYRYSSYTGSTFTLNTEVTGTANTGGSTTTLKRKTGTSFLTADIKQGDTVRNTTDGSWAVVDDIVDADTITTTKLQSGSDNTWSENDAYSFHKLATTLVSGTDKVDVPYLNDQTNASGNATASIPNPADRTVLIRIRYNEGATKYQPFVTSGSFLAASGLSVTCVLDQDVVQT